MLCYRQLFMSLKEDGSEFDNLFWRMTSKQCYEMNEALLLYTVCASSC